MAENSSFMRFARQELFALFLSIYYDFHVDFRYSYVTMKVLRFVKKIWHNAEKGSEADMFMKATFRAADIAWTVWMTDSFSCPE